MEKKSNKRLIALVCLCLMIGSMFTFYGINKHKEKQLVIEQIQLHVKDIEFLQTHNDRGQAKPLFRVIVSWKYPKGSLLYKPNSDSAIAYNRNYNEFRDGYELNGTEHIRIQDDQKVWETGTDTFSYIPAGKIPQFEQKGTFTLLFSEEKEALKAKKRIENKEALRSFVADTVKENKEAKKYKEKYNFQ